MPAPVTIATAKALCGMARPSAASQEAARPDATTQASAVPCTTFVAGTSGAHLVRCAAVDAMPSSVARVSRLSPMLSAKIGICGQRPLLLQRLHGDSRVSDVCYEQECGSGWAIPAPVNIATAEALCGMARPSAASQEAARPDATIQASAAPCTTSVAGMSGAHLVHCAAVDPVHLLPHLRREYHDITSQAENLLQRNVEARFRMQYLGSVARYSSRRTWSCARHQLGHARNIQAH